MIKPQKNLLITGFFNWYISRIIKRNYHSVNFNKVALDPAKPVLLIANHCSWWDGFILRHINRIYFKKKFHAMVLEETMQKVKFFKYLGGFSVKPGSKNVLQSLTYAAELLNDPQNMVVIFPQGKLYSNFVDEVVFEKGLFKITELTTVGFQYVFAAMFTENFDQKKPTVNVSFNVMQKADIADATELQNTYQQHYAQAKQRQTQIII